MFPFHHPSLQFHHPRSSTLVLQAFWIFCSHFSLKKKPLLLFHTTSDQKIQNWFSTNYKIHPFSIMSLSWFTSISHVVWKLPKMSHFIFCILLKLICLVTLFAFTLRLFKIVDFFGFLNEFLSTENVNVARFARNDEWAFLCDFQTLCLSPNYAK